MLVWYCASYWDGNKKNAFEDVLEGIFAPSRLYLLRIFPDGMAKWRPHLTLGTIMFQKNQCRVKDQGSLEEFHTPPQSWREIRL
jgi:hypothetical protein